MEREEPAFTGEGEIMKRLVVVLVVLVLCWGISPSDADSDRQTSTYRWEVVVLDGDHHQFYVLSPDGKTPLSVPACLTAPAYQNAAMSSSRRFVVLFDLPHIRIADLKQQTCLDVPLPDEFAGPAEEMLFRRSIFSPDETQVAISYASYEVLRGQIAVIDLNQQPGTVLHTFDLGEATDAIFYQWTEEGIYYLPHCMICEGIEAGPFSVLDPESGDLQESDHYVSFRFSDTLEQTGERVVMGYNENFIHPFFEPGPPMPLINVAYYYASLTAKPVIVFHDPARFGLPHDPTWVMDGQAVLMYPMVDEPDSQPIIPVWLVFRSGERVKVELPSSVGWIIGTPDGWIVRTRQGQVDHYRYAGGQLIVTPVTFWPSEHLVVLQIPPLGATAGGTFAPMPDLDHYRFSYCDTLPLPPRLALTMPGQVITPEGWATLYSDPDTSSAPVGTFQTFTPENGPTCADGTVWWFVRIGDSSQWDIGWAQETRDGEYVLETTCPPPHFEPDREWIIGQQVPFYGYVGGYYLYAEPSDTSTQLAPISDGDLITILAGPVCHPYRQVWWQVNYNGLVGWLIQPKFMG
jgi:hypothetical protein